MITSYKDLDVWKKSVNLVKEVYLITKRFPREEIYCLVSQMRRCAISIPSNIAEGKSRQHMNEYVQFLYIALGSCAELETQIVIAKKMEYINDKVESELLEMIDHIGRMIRSLARSLRLSMTDNREPVTDNRCLSAGK